MQIQIYYGTNRAHVGDDRWHPVDYGIQFSADGMENLRFGKVILSADDAAVSASLQSAIPGLGAGDGELLATLLEQSTMSIEAFREALDPLVPDVAQPDAVLGSQRLFAELKQKMDAGADVLVFIHGYNTSWRAAVATAAALQLMLNSWNTGQAGSQRETVVVLFSWPSDGMMLPFTSYRSDRSDAEASGKAIGRGLLKFRDFLLQLSAEVRAGKNQLCGCRVHLLCHSMGNYVLQGALPRIAEFAPGAKFPRLLDNVFLCAADVDDDVLEPDMPLGRLDELCDRLNVYYNRQDRALLVSDVTKGNPVRLGARGPARLSALHNKVEIVDCTPAASHGVTRHSYFLDGVVNRDIWFSIVDALPNDPRRARVALMDGTYAIPEVALP